MCFEVLILFTRCQHKRYFLVPRGTTGEAMPCYRSLDDPTSHFRSRANLVSVRIIDTVHECTQAGCGVDAPTFDYMTTILAALTRRETAPEPFEDVFPRFPWGVGRGVLGVQWLVLRIGPGVEYDNIQRGNDDAESGNDDAESENDDAESENDDVESENDDVESENDDPEGGDDDAE